MNKRAFTLIELIIYIAISAVVITFLTSFVVQIFSGINTTQDKSEEQRELLFAITRITREIQLAQGINATQSVFGTSSSSLALVNSVGGLDKISLVSPPGVIRITRSNGSIEDLTTLDAPITSLIFTNESRVKRSGIIHVSIKSSKINAPFETSISFREHNLVN